MLEDVYFVKWCMVHEEPDAKHRPRGKVTSRAGEVELLGNHKLVAPSVKAAKAAATQAALADLRENEIRLPHDFFENYNWQSWTRERDYWQDPGYMYSDKRSARFYCAGRLSDPCRIMLAICWRKEDSDGSND